MNYDTNVDLHQETGTLNHRRNKKQGKDLTKQRYFRITFLRRLTVLI